MRSYKGNVWAEENKEQGHDHHASVAMGSQPRPFLQLQLVMEPSLEPSLSFPAGQAPKEPQPLPVA